MFLLSSAKHQSTNEEALAALYSELRADFGLDPIPGEESWDGIKDRLTSGLVYIGQKLKLLGTRLLISLRNLAEKVFLRYSAILTKWNSRIKSNMDKIDTVKFGNYKTKVVTYETLIKRIDALVALHHVLDNIERVCEAPVKEGTDDWRTSELMSVYNAMQKIGFDANRFNLIGKVSSDYDASRHVGMLSEHGYSIHELKTAIEKLQPLAQYAQNNSVTQLSKRFVDYSDKLTAYEASLKSMENVDDDEREANLHVLHIKLARLWWVSHFIKSSYVVANDIVIDVLKICKIAEACITKE